MCTLHALLLWLAVVLLGYAISKRFRFYVKLAVFPVWLVVSCTILIPFAYFHPGPHQLKRLAYLLRLAQPILGIRYELHARENIKDKAYIVVSNHQSHLDVLATMNVWDAFYPIVAMLKKELKTRSLTFGLFVALSGIIFVDRSSFGNEAKKTLQETLEKAKKTKTSIWIFPEGTRNKTTQSLLPFKKGAFHMAVQAQIPILPVVLSDYSTFYSANEKRFDQGSITLTVLPEISTDGMTADDVSGLCEKTENIMRACIEHQRMLTANSNVVKCQ